MGSSRSEEATVPRETRGWDWGPIVSFTILAGLVALLYQPVLPVLVRQWWDDPNYSHGFLIPLVSGYLVWDRRQRLRTLGRAPSFLGLPLLVGGAALLLLGNVAAELFTMRVSLLVVLVGLVLFLLGREHLKALAFPILYLIFMVPPPGIVLNAIAFPLQLFAAHTATSTLQLLDIPVLREGNLITLANTSLEVAEACSGIRSLVTLLALATTLAYFTQRGFWRAGALVVSAVPIAIAANASRVAGTGILAHYYGPKVAQGFFHTFSGWFLFLVATLLLGLVGTILAKVPGTPKKGSGQQEDCKAPSAKRIAAGAEGGWQQAAGSRQPFDGLRAGLSRAQSREGSRQGDSTDSTDSTDSRTPWTRVGTAAVILGIGIVASLLVSHGEAVPNRRALEGFPSQLGPWRGAADTLPPAVLDVLRVTDYMMRPYAAPGRVPITLYVGYYETQRQGQVIHSPQQCLPGSGWNFLSHQYLTTTLPGRAEPATINNVLVGKGEDRQIVLYWYQERGRIVASEYTVKLYMIRDAIVRNRTDGALVRLSAPVQGSVDATLQQLLEFARLMYPALAEFLPG